MKKIKIILIYSLLTIFLISACVPSGNSPESELNMNKSSTDVLKPELDRVQPKISETATFAMG